MRITFHSPIDVFCSWNVSGGIPAVLRRMGHEIDDCWNDTSSVDLAIISGPEHLEHNPRWRYHSSKVAYYFHETTGREDHEFAPQFESLSKQADINIFPSKSDAERFGGYHLPWAVDTAIFNAEGAPPWEARPHKIAFVGQMYEKRVKFMDEYRKLGGPEIELAICSQDTPERTARALANHHQNTQIFVCLPQMCRCASLKIVEAGACGCCVVAPLPERGRIDRTPVYFYDEKDPKSLAAVLKYLQIEPPSAKIGGVAMRGAVEQYGTLERRLQFILDRVKEKSCQQISS